MQLLHLLESVCCRAQPFMYHIHICFSFCYGHTDHVVLKVPGETNESQCRGEWGVLVEFPQDPQLVGNLVDVANIICIQCGAVVWVLRS